MTISATSEESRLVGWLESPAEYHGRNGEVAQTIYRVFESSWAAHPMFGQVRREHRCLALGR